MKTKLAVLAIAVAILAATVPVFAHHSFAAQYDANKKISLEGVVTKVEWMNPHMYFYLNVTDAAGKVNNWAFENGNLSGLLRRGWRKDSLKTGDKVTVNGSLAKDGSRLVNAQTVTLSDGRKVFAGSSAGDDYKP